MTGSLEIERLELLTLMFKIQILSLDLECLTLKIKVHSPLKLQEFYTLHPRRMESSDQLLLAEDKCNNDFD